MSEAEATLLSNRPVICYNEAQKSKIWKEYYSLLRQDRKKQRIIGPVNAHLISGPSIRIIWPNLTYR